MSAPARQLLAKLIVLASGLAAEGGVPVGHEGNRADAAIVIVRDPRDVAPSLANHSRRARRTVRAAAIASGSSISLAT